MSLLKRNMPNETLTHFTFAQGVNLNKEIEFHIIEDGKLIILGAYQINSFPDGLYIDCLPVGIIKEPVQNENVLTINEVNFANQNENVLRIG